MKIEVNINKKYFYSIVSILIILGGVFIVNALNPGETPDPGHNINTVGPPAGCIAGQYLQYDGNAWTCDAGTGGDPVVMPGVIKGTNVAILRAYTNVGDDNCVIDFHIDGFTNTVTSGLADWKGCVDRDNANSIDLFDTFLTRIEAYYGGTCEIIDKDGSGTITYEDFGEYSSTRALLGFKCN